MLENARRQLIVVALSAVFAVLFLSQLGVRLGLDLSGGTQLIYEIDVAAEKEAGNIPRDASENDIIGLVEETIGIITERIDPDGNLDAVVTRRGSTGILIELPQRDDEEARAIEARIETLGRLEFRMVADAGYGEEQLQPDGTTKVVSFNLAEERTALTDWLSDEKNAAGVQEDPSQILLFNTSRDAERGNAYLRWYPRLVRPRVDTKTGNLYYPSFIGATGDTGQATVGLPGVDYEKTPDSINDEALLEFVLVNMHEEYFTGEHLNPSSVRATNDGLGKPALGYEMNRDNRGRYADWSGKYKGQSSAIILNGFVETAPVFNGRIDGPGIIRGNFTRKSVAELEKTLRTGSLQVTPIQQSKSVLGATLGEQSIELALYSISIGAILVLSFILFYYRLAGIVAFAALLLNVLMIVGLVAATRSTLTLPGLAGLVLTMGMAIDANILIYERIREELNRGKEVLQACRTGFDRAIVTIIDANITTFIAGLVLYQAGTGPISGFAVTLMIGIITTLFTAFFVSRLVFHYLLEAGKFEKFETAQWLRDVKFDFMAQSKKALVISSVVVATGLAVFIAAPRAKKYAIDFTGGANLTVVLAEAKDAQEVRNTLDASEFAKAYGKSIVNTIDAQDDGKSTRFTVRVKLTDDQVDEYDKLKKEDPTSEAPYLTSLSKALEGQLIPEPFGKTEVQDIEGTGIAGARVVLNFQRPVEVAKLAEALSSQIGGELLIKDAATPPGQDGPPSSSSIAVNMEMRAGSTEQEAQNLISDALESYRVKNDGERLPDVDGNPVELSTPIPESSQIGGRIVGDLRNSAITALVISLFAIVLFIRVRFHEYKYGIAAVAALLHDVLVTLGIVVAANWAGIIDAEIDLAMIAAFLTIIGYSINDTIVIFDRVRENLTEQQRLGEKVDHTELLNRSIRQTLSRTILTTLTTMLVVVTQFVVNFGGDSALEGFSFALMVGLLSGTYSTIFVASPVVRRLWNREQEGGSAPKAKDDSDAKLATSGV